jgi:hypothetical protein
MEVLQEQHVQINQQTLHILEVEIEEIIVAGHVIVDM